MLTSKYLLRWHHVQFGNDKTVPSKHRGKRGTIAKLYTRPTDPTSTVRNLVAVGYTSCSPSERTFNKALGRFKSMQRAIEGLPRSERAEFYTEFFAETSPDKLKPQKSSQSSSTSAAKAKVRMS